MRKVISLSLSLALLVSLSGCALLIRDVYFKEANSDYKKNYQEIFAGHEAVESYALAAGDIENNKPAGKIEGASPSVSTKKVHVSVANKESITYLAGIIVPIVPVFFWPGSKSHFDPEEKLRISCYFEPDYHAGIALKDLDREAKLKGFPECETLQVVFSDGRRLDPIHESKRDSGVLIISEFEFNVKVATVKNLRVENIVAKQNGKLAEHLDAKFNFVFEDWTRYLMPRMN